MFELDTVILIVDDMNTMRRMLRRSLTQIGFSQFIEASDGVDAWAALNQPDARIGVVFSDWNMPRQNGIDLLKRVRADEKFRELPFIMVTAEFEAHQVREAIHAGASNYIGKPFGLETLRDRLSQVYAKTRVVLE